MQEWRLAISRCPKLVNNATRPGPNSTLSRRFAKYGKRWQRRKSFRIWSGLSESNRHLNLGKVRVVNSNALERRHLAFRGTVLIGKRWKMSREKNSRGRTRTKKQVCLAHFNGCKNNPLKIWKMMRRLNLSLHFFFFTFLTANSNGS